MDLKNRWIVLCAEYTNNSDLINHLWLELVAAYSGKKRHYHNLKHIEMMYSEFDRSNDLISDRDSFQFAIIYHDIIYNVTKNDNEEKSGQLACERLIDMGYPKNKIQVVQKMIQATKSHNIADNADTNLLVDIDMAVLGYDWEIYKLYAQNVRKEYSIYPDFMYKKGRREVLRYFLNMDKIYKTEKYQDLYETKARTNIQQEMNELL